MTNSRKPNDRSGFQIAIICALEKESATARALFDEIYGNADYGKEEGDDNTYTLGRLASYNAVLVHLPEPGKTSAATAATSLRFSFRCIKLALVVGVCGGVPKEHEHKLIVLGDVIISTGLVQYDLGKQYPDRNVKLNSTERNLPRPTTEIRTFLAKLKAERDRLQNQTKTHLVDLLQQNGLAGSQFPGTYQDKLFESIYHHKHHDTQACDAVIQCGESSICDEALRLTCVELHCADQRLVPWRSSSTTAEDRKPAVHFGRIASGDIVMKSGIHRDRIAKDQDIIAFEMEGAGVWEKFNCIVIKGVCDYADSHKNNLWQPYAAATAIACTKACVGVWSSPESDPDVDETAMTLTVTGDSNIIAQLGNGASNVQQRENAFYQAAGASYNKTEKFETHHHYHQMPFEIESEKYRRLVAHLAIARTAGLGNSRDYLEPECLAGTRTEVLQYVECWANNPEGETLFWLSGEAGAGKSTISRTVARSFKQKNELGASFFFRRGEGERGHAKYFFATVAIQLADHLPEMRPFICSAVETDQSISEISPKEQLERLIVKPLANINFGSRPTKLIIVDALDECEGDEEVRRIIHLLARLKEVNSIEFRVFLTSRPELPIRLGFKDLTGKPYQDLTLHEFEGSNIRGDISRFLNYELSKIRPSQAPSLSPWPGKEIVESLVEIATPLFIYAATLCRFIADNTSHPDDQIDIILQSSGQSGQRATKLENLYQPILERLLIGLSYSHQQKLTNNFRLIVGTIINLSCPLSISSLSRLLFISENTISTILDPLHSVLNVPGDNHTAVRLFHLSFRDFLLSSDIPKKDHFWVNEQEAHMIIAQNCIKLMSKEIKRDICNFKYLGILRCDIDEGCVENYLPSEVRYACRYWANHLKRGGYLIRDECQVHKFLREHLLHWLEALSLTGNMGESVAVVDTLASCVSGKKSKTVDAFIHDVKRFVLRHRSLIDRAPLQTYVSAIIFTPQRSFIRKTFCPKTTIPWISRLPTVQDDWDTLLQTLVEHDLWVGAVSFSPNGKFLASVSGDGNFRLWDTDSESGLRASSKNISLVEAVAFSPDNTLLASASVDQTIGLWDVTTGVSLRTLIGHTGPVVAVDFSLDNKLLASGSDDMTIRIWDPITGDTLHVLTGHVDFINALKFSSNSELLASTSNDKTVKIWNMATQTVLHTLEGHKNAVTTVTFSKDSRMLVSAQAPQISADENDKYEDQSNDSSALLWCTCSGELLRRLRAADGHKDFVFDVAFSPNGKFLASASKDKAVGLWDATTGSLLKLLKEHRHYVRTVSFSYDDNILASASDDRTIKLWDTSSRLLLRTLEGHTDFVIRVTFSPHNGLLASASEDRTVRIWDAGMKKDLSNYSKWARMIKFSPESKAHTGRVNCLAFAPDGKVFASASDDQTIKIWDTATNELLRTVKGRFNYVDALAISPSCQLLALAFQNQSFGLWDLETKKYVWHRVETEERYTKVIFSPNGKLVALVSTRNNIFIHDTLNGDFRHLLRWHSSRIRALAFSPDSQFLASSTTTVAVWDVVNGILRRTIKGYANSDEALNLSFSSDSQYINIGQSSFAFREKGSLQPPRQIVQNSGLGLEHGWLTRNNKRILLFPRDREPTCSTFYENTAVIGHESGIISIIWFNFPPDTSTWL